MPLGKVMQRTTELTPSLLSRRSSRRGIKLYLLLMFFWKPLILIASWVKEKLTINATITKSDLMCFVPSDAQ
jgi:hypothetical protein